MPTNIWTYSGESGKRLTEAVRPFLGGGDAIEWNSLGLDRWTWSVPLKSLSPTTEEFPEEGQLVTLYRNGQRFFRGHALRPDQNDYSMSIDVVGPWHWLEKIPLTTAVTLDAASGGGAGVRTTIGFATQSMTTSLGTLIDRCIALGAPMIKGTIATTFSCIPLTVNNGSCADAIATLVRMIGDMSVWFDYSTGSGHPYIHVSRRLSGLAAGSMADVTLAAADFTPGQFKVVSQDELRVSQVRVPYYDRGVTGARRFQEQKSGTEEIGHVMILTASGKELDTFLPEEKLDSYVLQTVATSGTALKNWIMNRDGNIVSAGQLAGISPQSLPLGIGPATLQYQTKSSDLPTLNKSIPVAAVSFLNSQGQTVSTSGKNILISPSLPEWLKDQYTVEEVSIVGSLYYDYKESTYTSAGGTPTIHQLPTWWYSIQWTGTDDAGFRGTSSSNYSGYELFTHNFEIPAYLINASAPSGSTIYRDPDYTFISPPSGFSAGLLAARNWTPYKGSCGWKEQDCGAVRYMGKTVSITGADAELATMRAMVSSERLSLSTGATRLTLGPPSRLAYRTLLEAVRPNPNEQIVYL